MKPEVVMPGQRSEPIVVEGPAMSVEFLQQFRKQNEAMQCLRCGLALDVADVPMARFAFTGK